MTTTPVLLGEKPYGVSPSRVNQIETCPRQYQYTSIEKRPEKKKMETYRGTVFHAVMEEFFQRTVDSPEERTVDYCLKLFREMFRGLVTEEYAAEMGLDEPAIQRFARDVVKYIRNANEMEDWTKIRTEGIEVQYDIDMGGYTLRGILDRLDREEDGTLTVSDWKTGKPPGDQYKSNAILPAKIYGYMVETATGERPKKVKLLYVQFSKILEFEVTDDHIDYAEKRVREAWRKIEGWWEDQYFPPQRNNLCAKWCSFKNICPLFQPAQHERYEETPW